MKPPFEARLSRRALLRGLPAALVPLLAGRARGDAPFPQRLVIVQWTNGVQDSYWPAPPASDGSFTFTETLAPLERHRADILLLGGLYIPYGTAGHFSLPSLLTGAKPTAPRGSAGVGNAISLDQYVANALAPRSPAPIRSLELGGVYRAQLPVFRSVSFRGPAIGQRPAENPPEVDPRRVWRRLFGNTNPAFRDQRRSVLDYVARDLGTLMGRLPSSERAKLAAHLDATRELERELTTLPSAVMAGPVCQPAPIEAGLNVHDHVGTDRIVKVLFDLVTVALRCDLTRVITLMLFNAGNDTIGFPFLGAEFAGAPNPESGFEHHGIAHTGGPKKDIIDRWWMEQFAQFLDRLKGTPEGNGTLLDNTLVLFANHMGDGAAHNPSGISWILAGGGQRYFKTGRYLVHPQWNPATPFLRCPVTNGVLVGLANAMLDGVEPPIDHFGEPQYRGELPGLRG
jgi:hypothetical protein